MEPILENVFSEELDRIKKNLAVYVKKLSDFPRGAIVRKRRKNHYVNYLVYRNSDKVISDYIKKAELNNIINQLKKRDNIMSQIKLLKQQQKEMEKILKTRKTGDRYER